MANRNVSSPLRSSRALAPSDWSRECLVLQAISGFVQWPRSNRAYHRVAVSWTGLTSMLSSPVTKSAWKDQLRPAATFGNTTGRDRGFGTSVTRPPLSTTTPMIESVIIGEVIGFAPRGNTYA